MACEEATVSITHKVKFPVPISQGKVYQVASDQGYLHQIPDSQAFPFTMPYDGMSSYSV